MNQKLSDWASIAEIASGVAVVLTLVFLVLSINKNTEVTQASMFAGIIDGLNNINLTVVADPELRRIWSNYTGGTTSELSADEQEALFPIVFSRAGLLDTALSMRKSDLFGDNEWERIQQLICREAGRAESAGLQQIVMSALTDDYRDFVAATC